MLGSESRYLGSRSEVVRGLRTGAILGGFIAINGLISPLRAWRRTVGADIHPWLVASVIFFAGCSLGLVVGVVRPLTRRLPSAIGIATVAIFPAIIALDVIRRGPVHAPFRIHWTTDALAALTVGAVGTLAFRFGDRSNRTP